MFSEIKQLLQNFKQLNKLINFNVSVISCMFFIFSTGFGLLWEKLNWINFSPSDVFLGGRKDQLLLRNSWNSIPKSMRNYAQFRGIAHDDKCLSINMEKRTVFIIKGKNRFWRSILSFMQCWEYQKLYFVTKMVLTYRKKIMF